jgi:DNA-binding CsgD family transcriptional regulator
VLLSPPGDLCGLTRQELAILGLLVEGWPNRRIATALFITGRTVAAHIEHILAKLGTPTRTLAAVRALRLGHVRAAPAQRHPGIDPHRAGTRQVDRRVMCSRLPACRTPT